MKKNVEQAINFYCENERNAFLSSFDCLALSDCAERLGFSVTCNYGYANEDRKNIYLYFSVIDQNGNFVTSDEYNEYTDLDYCTRIVEIDKKERIKFYSWDEDDDFIESVHWALSQLNKKS